MKPDENFENIFSLSVIMGVVGEWALGTVGQDSSGFFVKLLFVSHFFTIAQCDF